MKLNGTPIKFAVFFILIVFLPFAKVIKFDNRENRPVAIGSIYEFYANRLKIFNDALLQLNHKFTNGDHNGKRSVVNNLLYEEFKRRLDKFNYEMSLNPNIVFKENSDEPLVDKSEKRDTVKDDACLRAKYKKKFDSVYDKFPLNEENFFETHSQQFEKANKAHKDLLKDKTSNIGKFGKIYSLTDDRNYPYEKLLKLRQNEKNDNNLGLHDFIKTYIFQLPHNIAIDQNKIDSDSPFSNKYPLNYDHFCKNEQNIKKTLQCCVANNEINNYEKDGMTFRTNRNVPFEENFIAGICPDRSKRNKLDQKKLSVGKKNNMTTLDLAKKLTTITNLNTFSTKNDPQLTAILTEYVVNTGIKKRLPKSSPFHDNFVAIGDSRKPQRKQQCDTKQQCDMIDTCDDESKTNDEDNNDNTVDAVSDLLNKVMENFEKVKKNQRKFKNRNSKKNEGGPCQISGAWNSYVLGLKFTIRFIKKYKQNRDTFCHHKEKELNIKADKCSTTREHQIMNDDWSFTGSALNPIGGPFYIYSQDPSSHVLATFVGFCRICGGVDTIFGSWTFLFPSKDCQDITTAIENKRDVFRRTNLLAQRRVLRNKFIRP